jgi:hypothetical protein
MKKHLIFLAFLLPLLPTRASDPSPPNAAPVTDPAQVAEHYRMILSRPEFQEPREPEPNERMRDWLSQWFTRLGAELGQFKYTEEMPRFASLLMTLFAFLSLGGLIYILVRLTRRPGERDREEAGTGITQSPLRAPEFYDEELRRTVAGGDWRGAWLASWRQFLSRLERDHLVKADRSRTNREYLAQLRAQSLPVSALGILSGMVDAYDNFIYGRRPIAEPDWEFFRQQVDEATLLLHLQDHPAARGTKAT